jgi:hypothetical protein
MVLRQPVSRLAALALLNTPDRRLGLAANTLRCDEGGRGGLEDVVAPIRVLSCRSLLRRGVRLTDHPRFVSTARYDEVSFTRRRRQAPTGWRANPTLVGGSDEEAASTDRCRQERSRSRGPTTT